MSPLKKLLDLDQYSLDDDHIMVRYFVLCFRDMSGLHIDNDRTEHCVYDFQGSQTAVFLGDNQSSSSQFRVKSGAEHAQTGCAARAPTFRCETAARKTRGALGRGEGASHERIALRFDQRAMILDFDVRSELLV